MERKLGQCSGAPCVWGGYLSRLVKEDTPHQIPYIFGYLLTMFLFLFSKAKQVTKNSNSMSTEDIVFQTVRLEETNNGNHLVIRQATPEAEGVSSKN